MRLDYLQTYLLNSRGFIFIYSQLQCAYGSPHLGEVAQVEDYQAGETEDEEVSHLGPLEWVQEGQSQWLHSHLYFVLLYDEKRRI